MQVAKWGNSLAVRLPSSLVEALELREGDDIEIVIDAPRTFAVRRKPGADALLERLRQFRGKSCHRTSGSAGTRRMSGGKTSIFVDSNVMLYLLSGDAARADCSESLLRQAPTISVHVLNEVTNVCLPKKLGVT